MVWEFDQFLIRRLLSSSSAMKMDKPEEMDAIVEDSFKVIRHAPRNYTELLLVGLGKAPIRRGMVRGCSRDPSQCTAAMAASRLWGL